MDDKIVIFKNRLQRLGIEIEIDGNFPWVYLRAINHILIKVTFMAKHGFTLAFMPIREGQETKFTNLREIFKLVRRYCK